MVVCWGGHSINENEYLYARRTHAVGISYEHCTAAAPGAMEGLMKCAAPRQRYKDSRFIGNDGASIIALKRQPAGE